MSSRLSPRDLASRSQVIDGLNLIGKGAVPLVIFTLGATLANGPSASGGAMPLRTVVGVLVAKLVVVPLIAVAMVLLCLRWGLMPRGDGPSACTALAVRMSAFL